MLKLFNKSVFINLSIMLLSTALCLIASELFLRIYEDYYEQNPWSPTVAKPQRDPKTKLILYAGESSLYAEPYDPKITIPLLVSTYLEQACPDCRFEIEMVATKGARLQRLISPTLSALDRHPDALVLLSGHNEFLDKYGSNQVCASYELEQLYQLFGSSRLFIKIAQYLERSTIQDLPNPEKRRFFDFPVACPKQWMETLNEYQEGIFKLTSAAKILNIPVFFVFPAGNEVGFAPNRSIYHGPESSRSKFESLIRAGIKYSEVGENTKGLAKFEEALRIDDRFALLWHQIGKIQLKLSNKLEAITAFSKARNFDGSPYRALDAQRSIIEQVVAEPNVNIIDSRAVIIQDRLLDNSVFHDMHHLTIEGYNLLAFEIANQLKNKLQLTSSRSIHRFSATEILDRFKFSIIDWLWLLASRTEWLYRIIDISFESKDRAVLLLQHIAALNELDPYFLNLVMPNPENYQQERLCALLRRAGIEDCPWPRILKDYASITNEWPFFNGQDLDPVHIGNISSTLRFGYHEIKDGLAPDGREIKVRGIVYHTGFGTHPGFLLPGFVTFNIPKGAKHFSANVAINDSGNDESSVKCSVYGDGKLLVQTDVLGIKDQPMPLKVQIEGYQELRLQCEQTEDGENHDQAVWLNPIIS